MRKTQLVNRAFRIAEDMFGVTKQELLSRKKSQHITYPRQLLMWYFQRHLLFTTHKAGGKLKRHHATAIHAKRLIDNMYETYQEDKNIIDAFVKACNGERFNIRKDATIKLLGNKNSRNYMVVIATDDNSITISNNTIKVNNKIRRLKYDIRINDIVEIINELKK